ncbi:MAG TPA: SRPBCC family protein [Solirubrobacteraceae bacterium]|nr:SRPBCC family protein [Solirubrobacteraceae bacterium]
MSVARASLDLPEVRISEVERLWYDHTRWQGFVDGLHHIERVAGDPPEAGSSIVWVSNPGGRGRVVERVRSYEPRVGQTLEVGDVQITGTQRVSFTALEGGVRIALELDYALRNPSLTKALSDRFFIRRAQAESLRRTLLRFGRELEAERHPPL